MAKQKGDILIRRDNDYVEELNIGVDGTVMVSDSTQDTGFGFELLHTTEAIAFTDINAGDPVVMLNDGSISKIITGDDIPLSAAPVSEAYNQDNRTIYDETSNKMITVYYADGAYYSKVGTITGQTISWGAASGPLLAGLSIRKLIQAGTDRFVICSRATAGQQIIVGTLSGTSITWGAIQYPPYWGGYSRGIEVCWNSAESKLVFVGGSGIYEYHAYISSGTITGTDIVFAGTEFIVSEWEQSRSPQVEYDIAQDKLLIKYYSSEMAYDKYYWLIVTQSGDTFTQGIKQAINLPDGLYWYEPISGKFIMSVSDAGNLGLCIITIEGDTVVRSQVYNYKTDLSSGYPSRYPQYDTVENKIIIFYGSSVYDGAWKGTYLTVKGTISGNTIIYDDRKVLSKEIPFSANPHNSMYVYDPDTDQTYIELYIGTNIPKNAYLVQRGTGVYNIHTNPYLGICQTTALSGDAVVIGTEGFVDKNQTGLTPGQQYYVANNGDIINNDISKVFAGIALTDTNLSIKGYDDTSKKYLMDSVENLSITHTNDSSTLSTAIEDVNTITASVSGEGVVAGDLMLMNPNGSVSKVGYDPDDWNELTTSSYGLTGVQSSDVVYDTGNDRIVIIYQEDGITSVRVGEYDGSSITWGTPVVLGSVTAFNKFNIIYEEVSGKIVMAASYLQSWVASEIYTWVGEVNPTTNTINVGSPQSIPYSGTTMTVSRDTSLSYHPVEDRVVFAWQDEYDDATVGGTTHTRTYAGQISGNSIIWGSMFLVSDGVNNSTGVEVKYDPVRNKMVYFYGQGFLFSGSYSTAIHIRTATLAGSVFTMNTPSSLLASGRVHTTIHVAYEPVADKWVLMGFDNNGDRFYALIFRTTTEPAQILSYNQYDDTYSVGENITPANVIYDPVSKKIILFWKYSDGYSPLYFKSIGSTLISNNLVWDDDYFAIRLYNQIDTVAVQQGFIVFGDTQYIMTNSGVPWMITKDYITNITLSNYMGISQGSSEHGNPILIGLEGYKDYNQSGLIAGQNYYLEPSGTLSTDLNYPFAGQAISDTGLIVKGYDDTSKAWTQQQINDNSTDIVALSGDINDNSTDIVALSGAIDAIDINATIFTVTTSGNTELDLDTYNHFDVTVNGDINFTTPPITKGNTGIITVYQSVGGHDITWQNGYFQFPNGNPAFGDLSTSSNDVNIFKYTCISNLHIHMEFVAGYQRFNA